MADNIAVTAGTGTTVAADEVVDATLGTVKVGFGKIMDGTLDSTNKLIVSAAGAAKVDGSAVTQPVSGSVSVSNMIAAVETGLSKDTSIGSLTETAPATDTASSGLNGRLQRIAQRLTSLISLFPASLGQKTMANSLAITLASDQTALSTTDSQTIVDNAAFVDGTSKLFMSGYILDDTAGTALTENDAAAARISTNRAVVSAIEDGTTRARYATVKAASTAAATADTAIVVSSAGANSATKIGDGTNNAAVKAASTASAFTDPAVTVSQRPGELFGSTAALADATANPTERRDAADNFLFNGSTWDRQRGMSVATTTGDTGAKTATGNGATQTNVGNKGIQIFIVLGTVSGTSPTCVFKLQGSVDGGTNWYDIPAATTASLTASTNVGIAVYPGATVLAGATTTGTTAVASNIIPRTWRVVWTIGGTTPSFTITSITYNYIPN